MFLRRHRGFLQLSYYFEIFIFCYKMKFPVSDKFTDFNVTLDNFLVSMEISYCQLEAMVFNFYQESNAVQSEILAFSWGISCILPFFSEIIVY